MASESTPVSHEAQPGPKEPAAGPPAKQRHILDIVFLQDSTGSQGPYIQACKTAITDICQKVSAHMGSPAVAAANASSDAPIRFGLIAFRDHPPQDTSWVTKKYGFTSSVPEMTKWLGGLKASGGGDGPEASTAAMADALNLEWRQSEEGENGVKAVKIVVLITDAPPHGLGEIGDGFPNGSPDQNDPLDIARQMAEHGISLYVIACEPSLSRYKHAVDFYKALTQITSGRMVPLLNASQLGDYIIGSALETLETEELIAQFQNTILEDVYGQGKSVEEVVEKVQQQLQQQQAQIQTLQVDDVYAPSAQATANVASWASAGKLGEARGLVREVQGARMKQEYLGSSSSAFGMPAAPGGIRTFSATPCGATRMGGAMRGGGGLFPQATGSALFGASSSSSFAPPPPPAPMGGALWSSSAFGAGPSSGGAEEPRLPQVQMQQQAVSMDQTRRLVMQGLSRHAKVGPGGKLTPKGVWAKDGASMDVDGPDRKSVV